MEFLIGFMLFCLFVYNIFGLLFARSSFWKGLRQNYACSVSEYKAAKWPQDRTCRFVYSVCGKWYSNGNIETKVDEDNIYMGTGFVLDFFIRPVKIPRNDLFQDGYKRYYFNKRIVLKVKKIDIDSRSIAVTRDGM